MLNRRYYDTEPDSLAIDFLCYNHIWNPDTEQSIESEPLHPALQRHLVREAFERGDFTLRFWRDDFYEWQEGCYNKISDSEMKSLVTLFINEINQDHLLDFRINIRTNLINNILQCLSGIEGVHISERREINSWNDGREAKLGISTIVFKNGLLMTDDNDDKPTFRGHTPHYFTFSRLPYNYDPHADCPKWREFLDDVTCSDAQLVELLCHWAGYLLMPDSRYHKFMLIAGEGQNGKTVFTTVLERMLGVENVTHIPLSRFSEPFALAATIGKMLNSSTESSHRLDELAETELKSYTSGDRMTFQRKYKEPLHAVPTAKVMISTNQLPQFADKSMGIWRRLLFVPFEKNFPEHRQNPHLADELSEELSGIFNWAYNGMLRLRKAGRFFTPQKCNSHIEQYRRDTNPARSFLLDNYSYGLDFDGLPCKEVYDYYVSWCHENGYRPLNSSNFSKEVKRTMPKVLIERIRNKGKRQRIYQGLQIQEGSEITSCEYSPFYQS